MTDIVITHAKRTPIGRFGGTLAPLGAVAMGTHAVKAVLAESGIDPALVNEVYFGHARQAGCGPNPARQVTINAGLPQATIATTVNMACASGLKAVVLAAQQIQNGEAEVCIAGGMESMSNVPHMIAGLRDGLRMGHQEVTDLMYRDGFLCPLADQLMGRTAETLREQYAIAREEQDAFAAASHNKAEAAIKAGNFKAEIAPITLKGKKGDTVMEADEPVRFGQTAAEMAKLKPVFMDGGTVHPGNASGITDGASALLLMSAKTAAKLGLEPLARIEGWAFAGVDPKVMGIGPVPATRKLNEKLKLAMEDYDLVELNEAFAAQVLACDRELHIPPERLNVNGGAIALGHPIGNTGARIITTLVHAMRQREAKRGLATLCVSGGLGASISLLDA
ncbi:MAG: acetyl-CoA C-acetyltransferase [Planctomycetes bacterium]|nr:acetyl-CoA C-acetyltransferase [Planctomycetota bacterium]MCW8135098.1 acetyl-CoA C-acetyltransferase [Planctomycetota bacterium]